MTNDDSEIPKRGTQKEFGRCDEDAVRKSIADRLKQGIEAVAKKRKKHKTIFSHHEQEDIEKRIAFDYAKENGMWIDDLYSIGKPTHAGGYENTLALDDVTGFLYKSNNLFNANFLISKLLEQVRLHNELFPETKYELVGFTGFDNGKDHVPYVEVVLKQIYVDNALQTTLQEILDFMTSLEFEQIDETTFTNGQYTVSDLYPRNVLKDKNGFIYVVDDIVVENKQ